MKINKNGAQIRFKNPKIIFFKFIKKKPYKIIFFNKYNLFSHWNYTFNGMFKNLNKHLKRDKTTTNKINTL